MLKYTEQQINNVANLLNNLTIRGIEDAKRVAVIAGILNSGEKADNDYSKK